MDPEPTETEPADEARRRRRPIGTVVGATLGPFGAAIGSVVDDTRFALTFTMGTGAGGGSRQAADEGTSIEIQDDRTDDAEGDADDAEH